MFTLGLPVCCIQYEIINKAELLGMQFFLWQLNLYLKSTAYSLLPRFSLKQAGRGVRAFNAPPCIFLP